MVLKEMKRLKESKAYALSFVPVLILVAYLQYYTVELSFSTPEACQAIPLLSKVVGVCTVLLLDLAALAVCKKIPVGMGIAIAATTLLAVANYFVLKFRGTPFTFVMIQNFTTAMNVIGSYRFVLELHLLKMLGLVAVQLALVSVLYWKMDVPRLYSAGGVALLLAVMYWGYLGQQPVIPNNVVGWSWNVAVEQYGYLPSMVKCTLESRTAVRKPDGYDESWVREYVEAFAAGEEGSTPDVIVILNETFYDMARMGVTDTDVDPMAYIHSLENSIQGYCYAPCEGGGTNVSEYELLTSNSIYLSPNSNPFNTIDISGGNSFASYLESLGYTSFGAHSEPGMNYARDAAYPALGFDEIHFAEEFQDPEYYYGRLYKSDASLYRNLIRWYEEMDEGPRVMYLLTIQNHANYDYLKEEEYLVHAREDYGELTGQINEYLTCMSLSDEAFRVLVEYFENVERDVIICMVGDHAPIFVRDMGAAYEGDERASRTFAVPYVVWSNHIELDERAIPEETCMPFLVPTALKAGGVKLSAFYEYIVDMQQQIPYVTSFGRYSDTEGNRYTFADETPIRQILDRYFDLAYANMVKADFMME